MKGKAILILGALVMVTVFTVPTPAQAQNRILQQNRFPQDPKVHCLVSELAYL
jgi:hypothetical protein